MTTSMPTTAPTALVYDGRCPELFLVFDRQVKRWLRRRFKGLTKYFWDGKLPTITADNYKELCLAIYQSLLKTNPSYAVKVWKKRRIRFARFGSGIPGWVTERPKEAGTSLAGAN